MLYEFVITPSLYQGEPGAAYFLALGDAATTAVAAQECSLSAATDLCEYLDCVDAGDLQANQPLYRHAVTALSDFLTNHCDSLDARALSHKSFAASTLLELVIAAKARQAIPLFGQQVR